MFSITIIFSKDKNNRRNKKNIVAAIANSGGIRASIGEETVLPGSTTVSRVPPQATSYKPVGAITQLQVESTLAFNNTLCAVSLTPPQIKSVLEEGLKAHPNALGGYPQVANIQFEFDNQKRSQVFDPTIDTLTVPGERVTKLIIDGKTVYQKLMFENTYKEKRFRIVTSKYLLENAGDNYPFRVFVLKDQNKANPKCFHQDQVKSALASFSDDGKEQDALAEYLLKQ